MRTGIQRLVVCSFANADAMAEPPGAGAAEATGPGEMGVPGEAPPGGGGGGLEGIGEGTGLMRGVAPGQAGMGAGGRPDLQMLMASLGAGGQPNLTAGVSRRLPI